MICLIINQKLIKTPKHAMAENLLLLVSRAVTGIRRRQYFRPPLQKYAASGLGDCYRKAKDINVQQKLFLKMILVNCL